MNLPRFLGCSLAALALAATGLAAPQAFEGTVRFTMTTPHGTVPMTYVMKDGLVRTEIEAGGQTVAMLMDFAKREMTMLMPQQKMYMVHPLPDPAAASGPGQEAGSAPDVQLTGQYETILGYKCQKIVVKTGDTVAEIWGAEGLGLFMNPGMGGPMGRGRAAPRSAWEAEMVKRGFFPLRVVTHGTGGQETFKMEATAIDTTAPDASLFAPPPDYKKFEMPAMPGLGGMNPFSH
ncbi:MAG TPA: DUF4412 domain-containing protein [Opitutaceae bacterium]|nr:DUF4412 domain-containing protein [Opitutaceae bacterium]